MNKKAILVFLSMAVTPIFAAEPLFLIFCVIPVVGKLVLGKKW